MDSGVPVALHSSCTGVCRPDSLEASRCGSAGMSSVPALLLGSPSLHCLARARQLLCSLASEEGLRRVRVGC